MPIYKRSLYKRPRIIVIICSLFSIALSLVLLFLPKYPIQERPKAISGSKYVFLNYLKGDIFAWLANDTNYKMLAADDQVLRDASLWRWESAQLPWGAQLPWYELPTQMIDGLTSGEYIKEYYKALYPDLKWFDVDVDEKDWQKKASYTKQIIDNHEDVIIFEPLFEHNINYRDRNFKYRIKGDILIKQNNKIKLVEAKSVGTPMIYHAIDVKYQQEIIRRAGYDVENWIFRLGVMDKDFSLRKDDPLNQIREGMPIGKDLFIEYDFYFTSRPRDIKKAVEDGKHKSLADFLATDYQKYEEFNNFDETLLKLIDIQLMDKPPINGLKDSFNEYADSDYLQWVLYQNGVPQTNSVFAFSGDSGFSFKKKVELFQDYGYHFITDVPDVGLSPKKFKDNWSDDFYQKQKAVAPKTVKRVLQKEYWDKSEPFMLLNKISEKLKGDYQLGSKKQIIMYDFETISMPVPMSKSAWPYEQVPYQFSAHIILDVDDFDWKTGHNIEHHEWLVTKKENMVVDFWNAFSEVMRKYSTAIPVSFNKSFEVAIMNNALNSDKQDILKMDAWVNNIIIAIKDQTVDLMKFFSEKYYYHRDFHGSYSIKVIAPHFAPEINYNTLDNRVQTGEQTASQAKNWLLGLRDKFDDKGQLIKSKYYDRNHEKSNQYWNDVREPMLKYCEFDTLAMVAIFQELLKVI